MTPHGRHVPSGHNDLSEHADPSGRSRSLTKGSGVAQRPLAHGRGAAARASRWGTGGACAGRGERRARVGVPERGARGPPSLPPPRPAGRHRPRPAPAQKMASPCGRQQCSIQRRGVRHQLDSWRHKLIHCVGEGRRRGGEAGPGPAAAEAPPERGP